MYEYFNEPFNPENLPDQLLWVIGVSNCMPRYNFWNNRMDTLSGCHPNHPNAEEIKAQDRDALNRDWGIQSTEEIYKQLNWLSNDGGHYEDFERQKKQLAPLTYTEYQQKLASLSNRRAKAKLEVVWLYKDQLGEASIRAFDDVRYVFLCRDGVATGFLTHEESTKLLLNYGQIIQQRYQSWDHLYLSYLAGRQFWSLVFDEKHNQDYQQILLNQKNHPHSIPAKLDWNLNLNQAA